jgi:hypothetical protein
VGLQQRREATGVDQIPRGAWVDFTRKINCRCLGDVGVSHQHAREGIKDPNGESGLDYVSYALNDIK